MPASLRAHLSRAPSSRPYDRRSPTASPAQPGNLHFSLSRGVQPASPIQATDVDADADAGVPPDRPGLPTYVEYKRIEAAYLHGLSPRKRDKALITQAMFDKIWDVLHQPEACTIDTPQFRFWVRKMFTLSRPAGGAGADEGWGWSGVEERAGGMGTGTLPLPDAQSEADEAGLELERSMGFGVGDAIADELCFTAVVLHENRPVAIMEQLYELFCYCHVRAGHGGRDKTCAVIREHYSWVPKELTAQFVKACPTCALKRSGQGHAMVGVDVGVVAHGRAVRRGGRRGRATPLEVGTEETSVAVGPLGLGWPTTGGPLDPANPEPCGVREREHEREWLRAREDVGGIGASSPVSPALGSGVRSVLSETSPPEWRSAPRALTLDASPFHPRDSTCSLGHPFAAKGNREEKENHSPTKIGLPSLASALSNESLDEHVNLAGRGPGDAAECLLPPALRPLRLLGPIASDTESDLAGPSSYPFQIDPVLLSFSHPGLRLSSDSGFASDAGGDTLHLQGLGTGAVSEGHGIANLSSHGFYRLRAPPDDSMAIPGLDPSREWDSPDSSFERTDMYTAADGAAAATLPFSLSTEFMTRSRCGSRYGYRDSTLAMLYDCSADEVGQEFDGPFSFSIMTDA